LVEGALTKIYEDSGEGLVFFSSSMTTSILGSSGYASKRAVVRVPGIKLRDCRVKSSLLSIGVTAPPTVRVPFRWKLEFGNFTISREMKPQFSILLEDSIYYKVIYDTKPLFSTRRFEALEDYTLQVFYDSAHPITLREATVVNTYTKSKLGYSTTYMSGLLVLEPGDTYELKLNLPDIVGDETILYATLLIPSPRALLTLNTNIEKIEVEGPGFKVVELQAPNSKSLNVIIEYSKPEIKIYPKKVLLTNLIVVNRRLPAPPLSIHVDDVKTINNKVVIDLTITNDGSERVEDIIVSLRQAMVNIKEIKLDPLDPGRSARSTIDVDMSKLPSKTTRKITVNIKWSKEGVMASKSIDVKI